MDATLISNTEDCFFLVCYCLVFLFGTIGNCVVIQRFGSKAERKKAGNKLVMVLAVNDFLASIFVPLMEVHNIIRVSLHPPYAWYLGKGMCHILHNLQLTFLIATSMLLIAISMERFR